MAGHKARHMAGQRTGHRAGQGTVQDTGRAHVIGTVQGRAEAGHMAGRQGTGQGT